jgi:CRP-like cAMP-binding protein
MQISQSDLFIGLGHHFLKEFMLAAEKIAFRDGQVVFRKDERADCFYILASGGIRLYTTDPQQVIYASRGAGEIIGWSSLIGRERYSLSAVCAGPTVLLRMAQERMNAILARDHEVGARFFRHLAGALGKRLLQLYPRVMPKPEIE